MVRREYKKREKIKAATFEFSQSKLQYLIEYQGKNGRPDKRFDKSLEGVCFSYFTCHPTY
mgnify:CR=1 FL=1|tara:strand:- start:2296 stop:2475 length:180 start_codon:yes stop_codon:yes gene_type:complete